MFIPKPFGSNSKTLWIQIQNLKDLLPPSRLSMSIRVYDMDTSIGNLHLFLIFFVLFLIKNNIIII